MEIDKVKEIVANNIETLTNVLDTIIRPEFHEVKEMLLGQLKTLNENIVKELNENNNC